MLPKFDDAGEEMLEAGLYDLIAVLLFLLMNGHHLLIRALGLSVGTVVHGLKPQERRAQYACDVTTNTPTPHAGSPP